jgi:PAS domain S-box-containing protein
MRSWETLLRYRTFGEMGHSEDPYRTMIDAIPAMASSSLPEGSVEFLNRRWLDYTGLSLHEALGWEWTTAVHPDDLDPLTDRSRALLASGQAGVIEARLRRYDGEYRWFLFRAEPMRDSHGHIFKWYGANTDIEDRKRAEALLTAEKRTLEMIAGGACRKPPRPLATDQRPLAPLSLHLTVVTLRPSSRRIATCAEIP